MSSASDNAKNLLEQKNIVGEDEMGKSITKATGASAFADLFNNIAKEANSKAEKEMQRPKYRFVGFGDQSASGADRTTLLFEENTSAEIRKLHDKIVAMNYEVEVIENLDCKDVTNESRYYIKITHKNGVYIVLDLLQYEANITDFDFDEQAYLEEEISKITGSVNEEVKTVAEYAVAYLSYLIYFKRLYVLKYKKIGWEYYDWDVCGWIFKYDCIYSRVPLLSGRGANKDVEELEKVKDDTREKESEWIQTAIQLLNAHPFDCLILGAGISGLVRQILPYTKETNININIKGEPASGKSTICHFLLGIFGNPELLEGSYTDTDNAVEQKRVSRPPLPYVLDDRMLKIENDSENAKRQKIVADIFREYEGRVKERVGKQYEDEAGERTYGPIISSSVKSMMEYLFKSDDLGQYRRFMEFDIGGKESGIVFSDAQEAQKVDQVAYKNYGIGIRIIIEYMLEILDGVEVSKEGEAPFIVNRFKAIENDVQAALVKREADEEVLAKQSGQSSKVHGLDSSSQRFALILLSYKILRESLLYYFFALPKEIGLEFVEYSNYMEFFEKQKILKDLSNDILEILIDNLVDKVKRVNKPLTSVSLYSYIMNNLSSGAFVETSKFTPNQLEQLMDSNSGIIGFYEQMGDGNIRLNTLYNLALDGFWEMYAIPAIDTIRQYCKEVLDGNMDRTAAIEHGKTKYNAVVIDKNLSDRNNKVIKGENVYFSRRILKIENAEGEEGDK
jgi:hypothetical protein